MSDDNHKQVILAIVFGVLATILAFVPVLTTYIPSHRRRLQAESREQNLGERNLGEEVVELVEMQ